MINHRQRIEQYLREGRTVSGGCGASSQQKDIAQQQQQNYSQLAGNAQTVFGNSSQIFQDLNSSFAPVVAAGPGQSGYTAPELAALNSQAITNNGIATRNAQQAAGERSAAAGGGTTILPNGATLGMNAGIAEAGAANTANALTGIGIQNAEIGRQNWMNAAGVLAGAPSVFNASTNAAGAGTQAGNAAMTGANDVYQANDQLNQDLLGLTEAGLGVAGAVICPAEGSLYLVPDGSEKPVEQLAVGDLIAGVDDEAQTIDEIQVGLTNVIRVCTENGFVARNSMTHAFVLAKGGFTVASKSLGKVILTADGPSKIISVDPDGIARVFNVITNGSHSYRADGIWALGVGDAERQISMDKWSEIGRRMNIDKTKWAAGNK